MQTICSLCLNEASLQQSHIIPDFILKWYKKTQQGPLRNSQNPNCRIQDYLKAYLLCNTCEVKISQWENPFCEKIFKPYQDNKLECQKVQYANWMLKFCVSISWRVLSYIEISHSTQHLSEYQAKFTQQALLKWKNFLFDKEHHPGIFEQHLILLDTVIPSDKQQSRFLNRYILTSCDYDLVAIEEKTAFVYVKFFKFIIIGLICVEQKSDYAINKIHLNKGNIQVPMDYKMPATIWKYINSRADLLQASKEELSKKQSELIENHICKNQHDFIKSCAFEALFFDTCND